MSKSNIQQFLDVVKKDAELLSLINSQVGDEAYSAVFTREAYLRGFQLSHEEVQAWLRSARMAYDAGELADEELEFVSGGLTTTTTTTAAPSSGTISASRRRTVGVI